jgi:hypothetical protein
MDMVKARDETLAEIDRPEPDSPGGIREMNPETVVVGMRDWSHK